MPSAKPNTKATACRRWCSWNAVPGCGQGLDDQVAAEEDVQDLVPVGGEDGDEKDDRRTAYCTQRMRWARRRGDIRARVRNPLDVDVLQEGEQVHLRHRTRSALWKMVGYFSGLSSPSVTESATTSQAWPRS